MGKKKSYFDLKYMQLTHKKIMNVRTYEPNQEKGQ